MNTLSFIKYCIVDGLKVCFPKTTLGIPEKREEIDVAYDKKAPNVKVPVDYVCKGLCFQCKHYSR